MCIQDITLLRTCPVYQQQCKAKGAVNVVLGMGGASLDNESYMNKPWWVLVSQLCCWSHHASRSVYHDQVFGYTRVQVFNSTHLYFAYHHNEVHIAAYDVGNPWPDIALRRTTRSPMSFGSSNDRLVW